MIERLMGMCRGLVGGKGPDEHLTEAVRDTRTSSAPAISKELAGMASSGLQEERLYHACYVGDIETVRNLLGSDVDVNYRHRPSNATPLSVACLRGHDKIVGLLLSDPHIDMIHVGEYLHEACGRGSDSIVRVLTSDPRVNVNRKANGQTPLFAASVSGQVNVVRQLLSVRDIDTEVEHTYKHTALTSAAMMGHTSVVLLLLEAKADTDHVMHLPDEDNRFDDDNQITHHLSAFELAKRYKRYDTAAALLSYGAASASHPGNEAVVARLDLWAAKFGITKSQVWFVMMLQRDHMAALAHMRAILHVIGAKDSIMVQSILAFLLPATPEYKLVEMLMDRFHASIAGADRDDIGFCKDGRLPKRRALPPCSFHHAAETGMVSDVKAMIAAGKRITGEDVTEALIAAKRAKHAEVVELLERGLPTEAASERAALPVRASGPRCVSIERGDEYLPAAFGEVGAVHNAAGLFGAPKVADGAIGGVADYKPGAPSARNDG